MSSSLSNDDTPRLTSEERDFVERLAEHYSPPPLTASERVAFDEALESRLSRRKHWVLKPLAVAATAAALGIWVLFHNVTAPDLPAKKGTGPQVVLETPGQQEGVGDVLLTLAFDESNGPVTDEWLPEDYIAISILLSDTEG